MIVTGGSVPIWYVSDHAIRRYIERIEPGATYEEARAAIELWSSTAHYVKRLPSGIEYWRAPKPTRARLRVALHNSRREVLTVLEAHDAICRRREDARRRGICVVCLKRQSGDLVVCRPCKDRQVARRAERRREWLAAGLCGRCGQRSAAEGHAECPRCRARRGWG